MILVTLPKYEFKFNGSLTDLIRNSGEISQHRREKNPTVQPWGLGAKSGGNNLRF